MDGGHVIAGRFRIDRLGGAGGMGRVYRAVDELTGSPVALKVLNIDATRFAKRFLREAHVLSQLQHPSIVSYIAHGETGTGAAYIAMEWVEGEDLRQRMNRKLLDSDEAVRIIAQVAEALAFAHQRGIIHRDLKPSNLMLQESDVHRVKLLDFGIARWRGPMIEQMTRTGISIGTPGYMAPEQARGEATIDGRADIFALGCVMFECMTGMRPYESEEILLAIAHSEIRQAPRASSVRPEIEAGVDNLLCDMIALEAAARPRDARELLLSAQIVFDLEAVTIRRGISSPGITIRERQLLCAVVVRGTATTASIDVVADELGGSVQHLGAQSVAIRFFGDGAASAMVARAARCALGIRSANPHAAIALATGRDEISEAPAGGETIDRARELLGGVDDTQPELPRPIIIDKTSAGLLDSRFDVVGDAEGLRLMGERETPAERLLLGRITRCVGRDPELAGVLSLFEDCIVYNRPKAVLVTAGAGIGKTRLRMEIARRVNMAYPGSTCWLARGDALTRGAPFHMAGQLVRDAANVAVHEPLPLRREKILRAVGGHFEEPLRTRVSEFLGELCGTPFPVEGERVQLRAARANPQLMGDQMRRAFEELLSAEAAARPVVLFLDDLHWGDLPSVRLIDSALRNIDSGSFLVVALAHPEIDDAFGGIWEERDVLRIRLGPLADEACKELIEDVLGPNVSAAVVQRLCQLSDGNAFYLEELMRAVAQQQVGEVPGTLLAMAQARLNGLSATERLLLRAGSIFGRFFWQGGIAAIVGSEITKQQIDEGLAALVDQEILFREQESDVLGELELSFRHELVRETAYESLTDHDRALGHKLAGVWLESIGSSDALTMAIHFELGGDRERAAHWHRAAGEQALEGNDVDVALQRARRGIRCGASGTVLGELLALEARALLWLGDYPGASMKAAEAMALLDSRMGAWARALGDRVTAAGHQGRQADVIAISGMLIDAMSKPATPAQVSALARCASRLFLSGRYDEASLLLRHLPVELASFRQTAPDAVGHVLTARANRCLSDGDPGGYLELSEDSALHFELSGDRRSAAITRVNVGFAHCELGSYAEAERVLRGCLGVAREMQLDAIGALARSNLGRALGCQGQLDEACELEQLAVASFEEQGEIRQANGSRVYLSQIYEAQGKLDGAEREARMALDRSEAIPHIRMQAMAQLARVLLRGGKAIEASSLAEGAARILETLGQVNEGESLVLLVLAESLSASGRHHEAQAALYRARSSVRDRSARLRDPRWREGFLFRVPENARIETLAREWQLAE